VDLIWSSREDSPYDVALEPDGSCWSHGQQGKFYRLSGDPLQPTLLTRATAQQVTALMRDGQGRVTFTTSNPGKVLRLSPPGRPRHLHVRRTRRADDATWGAIRWQAACRRGLASRSRRVRQYATPDET